MLNKAFKFFSSRSVFNTKKISTSASNTAYMIGGTGNQIIGDPEILWENICFIDDEKIIWTHGQFYASTTELTNLINNKADKSELNSYVSKAELSAQSYLTVYNESDPTVPSYVKGILESDINNWNSKQGEISDLETIRTSAFAGAAKISNIQGNWNTTNPADGSYIHNKPTIPDITGFATETYVNTKIAEVVNSAPETLDTLNELAAALGNDSNFATTVATQIGEKVSKTELSSQSYVTQTSLSSNSYITESALNAQSYVTQTSLSSNSYITQSALSSNSYAGYSYVYAAYSYILDTIIDNEYVVATGFNLQNDRLTVLENTVNNLDNNLNNLGFITQTDLSANSYAGYSYVYAAYSYIINSIIDNEYVVSGTLNEQNDRLTALETAGYITLFTETDPTVPSYVKAITQSNIDNWNSYANVQVNWNETDNSSYAYILNKPNIQTCVIEIISNELESITAAPAGTFNKCCDAVSNGKSIILRIKNSENNISDCVDYILGTVNIIDNEYSEFWFDGDAFSSIGLFPDDRIENIVNNFIDESTLDTRLNNAGYLTSETQADWNITDTSSAAYIKNKPTIPSITGLATETYVNEKVAGIVNSAPETLDTLNELATALGNDPNFATTVTTQIGERVTKAELSNLGYVTQTSLSSNSYAGYSYVYAAYSYIINSIIDNEYVIAQTFNSHNDRITTLETAGYITSFTETDPTVPSYVKAITEANITNWNSYANVLPDWNTIDSTAGSYILNKPAIPPDNVFIIPVTKNGTSYTTTVTKDEAREALFAGKLLFVLYNHIVMPLRHYDSEDYGDYYFYAISKSYIYTMNLVAGAGDGPLSCYYSETAIPAAITESTVAGWGFTKNTGTLTSETDPTVPSYVKSITEANINAWNSYANVQPDWNATSGDAYIKNKPTIPSAVTESTVSGWGFTKNTGTLTGITFNGSTASVTNGIAAITATIPSAVTESTVSGWGFTKNTGTVTGVTMNGASKGTSGVIDLGTVLTSFIEEDPTVATYIKNILESDISNWNSVSSKESNSNKVTSISASSTDTQYPSAKAVQNKISSLDGSASIASVSNDIVTIKAGVSEADGIISNDSGTDIVLAKVAKTGSPSDIAVQYNNENVSLQTALANIKTGIDNAASAGTQYIVSNSRATTPRSTTYNGSTGTLTASATTAGKVYLVPNGTDSYEQWITTQSGSTYSWTSLGSTTMDLSGVAKIITLNGKQYAVAEGTTLVDLGTVVTSVTGQTSISNGNTEYVHTVVNTTNDSNTGANVSSLETQVKIGNVSTGTAGLATATDVKTNLDNKIIIRTWSNS